MTIEHPVVSIVVPVYNVETVLPLCIASIEHQTLRSIQVILVDDGSTDASGAICDKAAENHSDWVVLHQDNGGLSAARNAGISRCKGNYIFFLDSDDQIHPQAIETLVAIQTQTDADIVEGSCIAFSHEGIFRKWPVAKSKEWRLWHQPEIMNRILLNNGCDIMACGKLIRADLFKGIRFPVGKLHEDEFTIPFVAERATIYAKTHSELYAYYQRSDSITHTPFSERKLDAIEAMQVRLNLLHGHFDGAIDEALAYGLATICTRFMYQYKAELNPSQCLVIEEEAKRALHLAGKGKSLPLRQRFSLAMQKRCPELFWSLALRHN